MLVAVDLFACSIPEVARALRAAHLSALRAARTTVQSERFRGKGDKELPFPMSAVFLFVCYCYFIESHYYAPSGFTHISHPFDQQP